MSESTLVPRRSRRAQNLKNVKVIFTPSGIRGEVPEGMPVLRAARRLGVDVESVCGGQGICGTCKVYHVVGDFPKYGVKSTHDSLSEFKEVEAGRVGDERQLGARLGCTAKIMNDVVIEIPASSQSHEQDIAKAIEDRDIELAPAVSVFTAYIPAPIMDVPHADISRLVTDLQSNHDLVGLWYELPMVRHLQTMVTEHMKKVPDTSMKVSVAIYNSVRKPPQIVAIWPGHEAKAYGCAIDLGSTSIVVHLADLSDGKVLASASAMNPQIKFGEDLMSRVSYAMMNEGGAEEMSVAVRQRISDLIKEAATQAWLKASDVMDVVIVCNPIMHHILLGLDPVPLGGAPFNLAVDQAMEVSASELDIPLHDAARIFLLPCLAGHIGADAAGVVLSERPDQSDELTLIVDVGTNAEIVLGNRNRMLAASSPTGPAFEGAQISCGQRAAVGAIERVRIDRMTLEPTFKVIGCDPWSNDPTFEMSSSSLQISGVCGSGIIEIIGEMFLAGIINRDGVIQPQADRPSPRVIQDGRTYSYVLYQGTRTLKITQNDVRAIQLAKAALYAGIRLLMDKFGSESVERIKLAGAFGSRIDVKYAMLLGMIPDCDLANVGGVGNAAGEGARIALVNRHARNEVEPVIRRIEKIETATEASFQAHFVGAMGFPHSTDPFPNLEAAIPGLADRRSSSSADTNAVRGRRRRPVK